MSLPPDLLEILVCPESKKPLVYFQGSSPEGEFLFCPTSRLKYRIDEGIPVMLIGEATRLSEDEAAKLSARARAEGLRNA